MLITLIYSRNLTFSLASGRSFVESKDWRNVGVGGDASMFFLLASSFVCVVLTVIFSLPLFRVLFALLSRVFSLCLTSPEFRRT